MEKKNGNSITEILKFNWLTVILFRFFTEYLENWVGLRKKTRHSLFSQTESYTTIFLLLLCNEEEDRTCLIKINLKMPTAYVPTVIGWCAERPVLAGPLWSRNWFSTIPHNRKTVPDSLQRLGFFSQNFQQFCTFVFVLFLAIALESNRTQAIGRKNSYNACRKFSILVFK